MAGLLSATLQRAGGEPALADERGTLTWLELNDRVNRWVAVLRGHGLGTGDRVAFVTGNRRTTFEALLACLHAGLVAVPISWRLTPPEIAYLLRDSGSRAVLADPGYATRVTEAIGLSGTTPVLAAVTDPDPVGALGPAEGLLSTADAGEPPGQASGSVMLYTSATTGQPKGVLTKLFTVGAGLDRVARTVAGVGAGLGIPVQGRTLLAGPWYHAAQVFFSLFPLLRGCHLLLRQRFDAADTLATLAGARVTTCHLVPAQFIRLLGLDAQTRAAFTGGALQRVWHGGAACPVDVKRRMIEWWGPVLTEYYAATEAGIVSTIDAAEWLARPGSVGRPTPPTEVVIVGEDGTEAPVGEVGRVYVRRPAKLDFRYHNAPEKTAAAYRAPGTFTVGDLGRVDADGYLYLTGRTLDTIISGGVNIYPAEVEAVLVRHPAVRDAAVFGIPDDEFGERVMAVVELSPAAGIDAAAVPEVLDAYCRSQLAGYKRPRRYQVVDELPREPSGKLVRQALREPYWQDLACSPTR
jgi:acyl-CoA synthetase (AMP-forming)/AMP-acid ligase II